MRGDEERAQILAAKFQAIFPHLDERQRRLLIGAEARALGHGGIRLVAQAAGVREATVSLGVAEVDAGAEPLGRARRPGGGRKRAIDLDPGLRQALLALVEPQERGDPLSPLRWTTRSTRALADELTRLGHWVSADTVRDLLRAEGFSLQGHVKTMEGQRHPDRDAQFRYINDQVKAHQDTADPVISVDIKKKELVEVPYAGHDLAANAGWVSVGTDHDTAAFAVEPVRRWWKAVGQAEHPAARRLLVTADAGGANGYRTHAWQAGLAALAAESGLEITCCRFPRGTSKWHKVEHRLFCHLTMNYQGRPLSSHEVTVRAIAATTTRTGPLVRAAADDGSFDTGVTFGGRQPEALPLTRHDWHGEWNYTFRPVAHTRQPFDPD